MTSRPRRTRPVLLLLAVPAAAIVALTGFSAGAAQASPDEAAPAAPSEAEVLAQFDAWNASLATGDPEQVNAHYAEDAVLLPTVSPGVHDTPEERLGYFDSFLDNQPSGVITESVVRDLGDGNASLSGLYTFTMGASGDIVPARFTFVYAQIDGEWKIVEHHSSKEPAAG
ncbi:SgcJ/EcaC family oxidoreductase [Rathayibacter tanaceti]|uniref:Calcium/calmodulin dependent protein kinase II Association n=2 Tax=Rathayibacter tanaceti TaxID=1671680 RepID=A0A162GFM9_9MICO|nr:SgcJ/EcaC family oxidoreductase [Rathayibacter tanaceti]KZX20399.1 Calcium/calmodulin dependent protein kinase II Association [Rathayibacter tanaceti]QHC54412.1 SgcJ/EcaC family oxidoreductase [Rathayibacter tanaceti]TCO35111.1 uncharacterized protein (TIGR02246 family) [Rathayibacter tanaceti]